MSFVRKVVAWLLPLLGLALAVALPWYLYARGSLDSLTSTFMVGSSIVIAEFTMALWWATQAQASATEGMRRLEEHLTSLEKAPLVVISDIAFSETARVTYQNVKKAGALDNPEHSSMKVMFKVSNVGRYGLVVKTVSLYVLEDGRARYPIRLLPTPEGEELVVAPGKSVMFVAKNELAHEHAYKLFRAIESCLPAHNSISEAWSCVGLAVEVVHGGSLGESEWLCFTLGLGAKTESGYRAVGYQSSCSKDVIVSVEKAQLLV